MELGKRFFPRCSGVLDEIMDDEEGTFGMVWTATAEEQFVRKRRYQELQDIVSKAFSEDKQQNELSPFPAPSSSPAAIGGIGAKLTRK